MSRHSTHRHIVSICKSIRTTFGSTHWTYEGIKLDPADNYRAREGLTLTWIMWSEALSSFPESKVDLTGTLSEWLRHVPTDIAVIVNTLKAADALILSYYEQDVVPPRWREFKTQLREGGLTDAGVILAPLKLLYPCVFLNHECDYVGLRVLRSCLLFLSRLNLEGKNLPLKDKAVEKWYKTEERIRTSGANPQIKRFFDERLSGWKLSDVKPTDFKHGTGACADCYPELEIKYSKFGIDGGVLRIWEQCNTSWPTSSECNLSAGPEFLDVQGYCEQLRISRQSAVPKSYEVYRIINLEPAHCMFMQKGVQASIYRFVGNDAYLASHCMVDNNALNRAYCYHASLDGSFVTLDLSAASDSITRKQVLTWMKDTDLYLAWWWTASHYTKTLRGEIIKPQKAFSMGSALCFPYEVFCFAAVIENSIRALGDDPRNSFYVVHGDDIIVERQYANEVIRQLEENGFLVNKDKSFVGCGKHIFRESCGVEYLDGHDVKPLRISRKFFDILPNLGAEGRKFEKSEPGWVPKFIDLANRAYGLFSWLRLDALAALFDNGVAVAFTGDSEDTSKVYSTSATNYNLQFETVNYNGVWRQGYYWYHRYLKNLGTDVYTSDPTRLYEVLRRMEENKDRFLTIDMVDPDRVVTLDNVPWHRYSPDPAEAGRLVRTRLYGEP